MPKSKKKVVATYTFFYLIIAIINVCLSIFAMAVLMVVEANLSLKRIRINNSQTIL